MKLPRSDYAKCQDGILMARCVYEKFGERCKLAGTMAPTTRADENTPFYCDAHFKLLYMGMREKDAAEQVQRYLSGHGPKPFPCEVEIIGK